MSKQTQGSENVLESLDKARSEIDRLSNKIREELAAVEIDPANPRPAPPATEPIDRRINFRAEEIRKSLETVGDNSAIDPLYFDGANTPKKVTRKKAALDRKQRQLPNRYNIWREISVAFGLTVVGWVVLYLVFALPVGFTQERGQLSDTTSFGAMIIDFRDYTARMTGTLPIACYRADQAQLLAVAELGWDRAATPLLLQPIWSYQLAPEDPSKALPCGWHAQSLKLYAIGDIDAPTFLVTQLLAAVSLEVGLIQKITLFVAILGWRLVGRAKVDMALTLGRLRFGRSAPQKANAGEDTGRMRPDLFPRRRLTLSNDPYLAAEKTETVINELAGLNPERKERQRLKDPYNIYCDEIQEARGSLELQDRLRDSMWQQTLNYIGEIAEEGQSQKERAPVSDRASKRADALRENIYRQFALADFVTWLLPTVGFLGTIYGISTSLVEAKTIFASEQAGGGDNATGAQFGAVVDSLGTAFDTTAFALLLLAFLMLRKMRQEARLSSTADQVVTFVRAHLVNMLRDLDGGRDIDIIEEANELIRSLTEYRRTLPSHEPSPAEIGET